MPHCLSYLLSAHHISPQVFLSQTSNQTKQTLRLSLSLIRKSLCSVMAKKKRKKKVSNEYALSGSKGNQ